MGRAAQAAEHYEAALAIYRGRFACHFPPEHPRVLRIARALAEIRGHMAGNSSAGQGQGHAAPAEPRLAPGPSRSLFTRLLSRSRGGAASDAGQPQLPSRPAPAARVPERTAGALELHELEPAAEAHNYN
eukprot:tig00021326_g20278.t1